MILRRETIVVGKHVRQVTRRSRISRGKSVLVGIEILYFIETAPIADLFLRAARIIRASIDYPEKQHNDSRSIDLNTRNPQDLSGQKPLSLFQNPADTMV